MTTATDGCYFSTIGGGFANNTFGCFATITGGYKNKASNCASFIGGGCCNTASGCFSFIGGGRCNTASGCTATIGGGYYNNASGNYSFIGGGRGNKSLGLNSTIGGGDGNCVPLLSNYGYEIINATIGGGGGNQVVTDNSTIGGGCCNCVCSRRSTIGGGYFNSITIYGYNSTIGGGRCNTVSSSSSTIAGGISNNVSGGSSTIGGGCCNTVSGCFSSIIGGQSNNDGGFNNIHIIGSNITGTTSDTTFVNNLRSLGSVSATTYQNLNNQIGLSGLSGVSITSVSDGDMLVYSGSSWMNKTQEFISRQNQRVVYTDFMVPSTSAAVQFPYVFTLINSGSVNSSLLKNGINPGVLRFRSSATTNSGVYLLPLGNALTTGTNYISPNTQVDYIFRTPATIVGTGINLRFGLGQSASSTTDLDNGYYIEMIENTLYGKTADGSIRSQTSTSFTTAINTWYHGRVKYISTSLVEYSLYSMDGTLLWNSTLTTNITTNPLNPLIIAISTNASAIDLVINDYFSTTYPVSNRGALN